MDAAMSSAITYLTAAVPALDADSAKAALEAAVPIPVRGAARFLEELTGHIDTHPDALTSGDSRFPPVLMRLTHVLHDTGHPVVRPGCAHCGKTVTNLRSFGPRAGSAAPATRGRGRWSAPAADAPTPASRLAASKAESVTPATASTRKSSRNARNADACATPWCGSRAAAHFASAVAHLLCTNVFRAAR